MPDTVSKTLKTARRAAATPRVRGVVTTKKKGSSPKKKAPQLKRRWQPEQRVVLSTTWKSYLAIDKAFGDDARPGVLLNYSDGQLEIMSTSLDHERIERILSACIQQYCLESDIYISMQGRMTRRAPDTEKGAEADSSYSFVQGPNQPVQLVIEVALTSGGIAKLPLYEKLGSPEVWIWRQGHIHIHTWNGLAYQRATTSARLPRLRIDWLEELSSWTDDYEAVREFRRRLARGRK